MKNWTIVLYAALFTVGAAWMNAVLAAEPVEGETIDMPEKIGQTAGRDRLGTFAPKFAELNDDVLFGEVWSRTDQLGLRDRSLITVVALVSSGITDSSLRYHIENARKNGVTQEEMAETLTHIGFYVGWPKVWAAFNLAKEVYGV